MKHITNILSMFIIMAATTLAQGITPVIPFQGVITKSDGTVRTATPATIAFRLLQNGSPVWTDNATATEANYTRGMISYNLGSRPSALLTGVDFSKALTLGIKVDSDGEIFVPINPSAYAMYAVKADTANVARRSLQGGASVTSLNGLQNAVEIEAGTNVRVEVVNGKLRISSRDTVKYADSANYVKNIPNDVPVGTIIAYAGETLPSNGKWELCNGALKNRLNPADTSLFNAIGYAWGGDGSNTFRLPDLRGIFLRGVSSNATDTYRDPDTSSTNRVKRYATDAAGNTGNKVGSIQWDEIKSHNHQMAGAQTVSSYSSGNNFPQNAYGGGAGYNTSSTGGSETRPKNAYVLYIIRAKP
ncbi:MAG: tail fiber protein [Candidatus Kapabacteria bacterium]|nr:tail fiber protein [Candidatus Kapabacteria bacterium]